MLSEPELRKPQIQRAREQDFFMMQSRMLSDKGGVELSFEALRFLVSQAEV